MGGNDPDGPPADDSDGEHSDPGQIIPGWSDRESTTLPEGDDEAAFALVGNETRAEIIRALGEARGQEGARPILSFSELHDAVDVDVVSSQFNYHLQQLLDYYVDQTEDGYRLRPEGSLVYRTIKAGTLSDRDSFGPLDVGFDCYYCGDPAEGVYDDGMFTVQCPGCETLYDLILVPPATLDPDDVDGLLHRIDQFNRHRRLAFNRDVCPMCANDVDTQFMTSEASPFDPVQPREVVVHQSCSHCGSQMYVGVGAAVIYDPGLVSFCFERGLDVTETPLWELEFAMTDRSVTVHSRDPWEVAVDVTVDGDTLELVVDEQLTVLERNYS
jgi:hypothetical protein